VKKAGSKLNVKPTTPSDGVHRIFESVASQRNAPLYVAEDYFKISRSEWIDGKMVVSVREKNNDSAEENLRSI
jgi:hypothetical protein